ncbi:FAD-dependent monooxygenase [Nocardia transvalensis]|uniref:FAD-dependent monooxygenase n=1 Tax=Nocardia transvalensis TaxID=37333 RepID=UPI001895F68D|nr:FAD-dependent monooxygenase [Nocardia transvalensis]MBF6331098.1 FAD-dependent monooxygenase [Nocardia transvalensis]
MRPLKAVVVGAGIGGLATAAALRAAGAEVEVYEHGTELRSDGAGLAIYSNGMTALRTLGLGIDEDIERRAGRFHGFVYRQPDGRVMRRLPMADLHQRLGANSFFTHRGDLMQALHTGTGNIPIRFGATAVGFVDDGTGVTVSFDDGSEARGDVLIGADGINSAVRAHLHPPSPPRPGGYVCWLACVPYDPSTHTHVPHDGYGHLYWGRGMRFGIHDIGHDRVYWWGTRTVPAAEAASWRGTTDDLIEIFRDWAPETHELIASTVLSDIVTVPAQDRVPLASWGTGRVTLLGDAAHPMLTALGQGANSAIEDAVLLAHALATVPDAAAALRTYEKRRFARTKSMVEDSRMLGTVEQTTNRLLIAGRDNYIRVAPHSTLIRTLAKPMTFPGVSTRSTHLPRPLTNTERWHWIADQLSPLNIVSRVRIDGPLSEGDVAAALSALQRRHPLLCAAVEADDAGRDPRWVPVADRPIALRRVSSDDPDAWLSEINSRELIEPLDPRGPMVRAVLITAGPQRHNLIMTSTYAIADPPAMLSLLQQTVALADRHRRSGSIEDGPTMGHPAIAGPEDLLPRSHRGLRGLGHGAASILRDQRNGLLRRPARVTATTAVEPRQRTTQVIHRTLSRAHTRALTMESRRRGLSLRAVLAAALLTAAGREAEIADGTAHAIGLGVDYRDLLDGTPSTWDLGAFQAMTETVGTYSRTGSRWELAGEIDRDLARRIARGDHLATVNIMSVLAPTSVATSTAAVRAMQNNGSGQLCLMPIVDTSFPRQLGEWRLGDVQVVSGISVSGLVMVTTTVDADELSLNLSYVPEMIPMRRAEFLADNTIRVLAETVETAPNPRHVREMVG